MYGVEGSRNVGIFPRFSPFFTEDIPHMDGNCGEVRFEWNIFGEERKIEIDGRGGKELNMQNTFCDWCPEKKDLWMASLF